MSEALFNYLDFARRRQGSWWRRLFLAENNLVAAGMEQMVETAAVLIEVHSQHENIYREQKTGSKLASDMVTFYDQAHPRRPTVGHFEDRAEGFPLRETLKLKPCQACKGQPSFECRKCRGAGLTKCLSCNGGVVEGACSSCSSEGFVPCNRCDGRGEILCTVCEGSGETATWDVVVYEWSVEERTHLELPRQEDQALRKAFLTWQRTDLESVTSLDSQTVAAHLGYDTPEALEVVERARERRRVLEREAHQAQYPPTGLRTNLYLVPVGHTVTRWSNRAMSYWRVGRGKEALEILPPAVFDPRKLGGWLGLGTLSSLAVTAPVMTPALMALTATGTFLVGAGLHRVLSVPQPTTVIAVLNADDEPSPWLPCIAHIGSYARKIRVLDRNYPFQLARLLRAPEARHRVRGLSLQLADKRTLRLVEVVDYDEIPDEHLSLNLSAVDGVLLLKPPHASLERLLGEVPPDGPPMEVFDYSTLAHPWIDEAPEAPLEALRRAYVAKMGRDHPWESIFDQLWRPVERLLEAESQPFSSERVA